MVEMNRFAGQKLRHRCREQTYGHQGGKDSGQSMSGEENEEFSFKLVKFKMPIRHLSEDTGSEVG